MRFAPPPSLRLATQTGGLNSMSVRSTNERLILSLLVQQGAMSRLDLGRKSGLSAQTISVITRALQRDGLIIAGEAQRGRVGPPTIPVELNPDGVCAIGLALHRSGIDVVISGLTGAPRYSAHLPVAPGADPVALLTAAVKATLAEMTRDSRARLAGIGLALPTRPGPWAGLLADGEALEQRLGGKDDLPVYIQNGATAAAGAESIFGAARNHADFLFVVMGPHPEYRLVLEHRVHRGSDGGDGGASPAAPEGPADWRDAPAWEALGPQRAQVLDDAASAVAVRVRSLMAFVAVNTLLVTGLPPAPHADALLARIARALPDLAVLPGQMAQETMPVGAATLALTAQHLLQE